MNEVSLREGKGREDGWRWKRNEVDVQLCMYMKANRLRREGPWALWGMMHACLHCQMDGWMLCVWIVGRMWMDGPDQRGPGHPR
jgi:hypothetical protein